MSPFAIYSGASDFALGTALYQNNKPVAFSTRTLAPAETRYCICDKELLAVVAAFQKWKHLLRRAPVTVYMDHQELGHLQKLQNIKKLSSKLQGAQGHGCSLVGFPGKMGRFNHPVRERQAERDRGPPVAATRTSGRGSGFAGYTSCCSFAKTRGQDSNRQRSTSLQKAHTTPEARNWTSSS